MSPSQFQSTNQQGSLSGVPSEDPSSAAAGEDPLSEIPGNLRFWEQLRQEVQEFQQQQQQQPPQEQVRLRPQLTGEQTRRTSNHNRNKNHRDIAAMAGYNS
jgi:hypothetical protein